MRENKNKASILIIDDELEFLERISEGWKNVYDVRPCPSLDRARELLEAYENAHNRTFDLILLDLVFGSTEETPSGIEFLQYVGKNYGHLPVIIITKHGSDSFLMQAMRAGAVYFFRKQEMNTREWKTVIDEEIKRARLKDAAKITAKETASEEPTERKASVPTSGSSVDVQEGNEERHPFIGETDTIISIREQLEALAEEPEISVLLLGETGVGKEVAARYLHRQGPRSKRPFKAVNLVAIGSDVLESTIFGHKKGAFTGAISDFKGAIEEADGGVLFLDEIGEINSLIQRKLLRFLEDKIITPVGGKEKEVDVQIVTATNRDLREEVEKGNFRLDLFHRLNDYAINIPPLRERQEDILRIATHYLAGKNYSPTIFTEEVWQYFLRFPWPGNVRELISMIKRLLLKLKLAKGVERVDASFLPQEFKAPKSKSVTTPTVDVPVNNHMTLAEETALAELTRNRGRTDSV